MRVRISASAQLDLQDQWLYLFEQFSLEVANQFEERTVHVLELLGEQPRMGRQRDDLLEGLRSFPLNRHCLLLYRLSSDEDGEVLEIVRVACGGREMCSSHFSSCHRTSSPFAVGQVAGALTC